MSCPHLIVDIFIVLHRLQCRPPTNQGNDYHMRHLPSHPLMYLPISPSVTPTTALPSTAAPSSNYPSLSPSSVFIISTIAGTGTSSFSGDNGQATAATLYYPGGVGVDASGTYFSLNQHTRRQRNSYSLLGNVYIADTSNQRVRKVTASTGIITTFAGTGSQSYSGDGGQATAATFNSPNDIATDSSGTAFTHAANTTLFTVYSPRQHVYCRGIQPLCPQGDDLHRDYHHRRWNRFSRVQWRWRPSYVSDTL